MRLTKRLLEAMADALAVAEAGPDDGDFVFTPADYSDAADWVSEQLMRRSGNVRASKAVQPREAR
jgi:hypothetical protein